MEIDFPLILVSAVLITGAIWLLDIIWLAPTRKKRSGDESSQEPALVEYAKSFFPVLFIVLVLRSFL